jgi:hypothetical protein
MGGRRWRRAIHDTFEPERFNGRTHWGITHDQRSTNEGETSERGDLQYILILRFHSFFSFDEVVAFCSKRGVGGVGAFHVGGT